MKLKYYLRGLGIGILAATIILLIASTMHEPEISDEQVIQRAKELGMVMKDEMSADESIPKATENEEPKSTAIALETEAMQSEIESKDTEQEAEEQIDTEILTKEETELEEAVTDTEASVEQEYVEFTIEEGQLSSTVADNLEAAGLVEDAWRFNWYLQEKNYDNYLRHGTLMIPKGLTYEELAETLYRGRRTGY